MLLLLELLKNSKGLKIHSRLQLFKNGLLSNTRGHSGQRRLLIELSAYLLLLTSKFTTLVKAGTNFIIIRALQSDDRVAVSALVSRQIRLGTIFSPLYILMDTML